MDVMFALMNPYKKPLQDKMSFVQFSDPNLTIYKLDALSYDSPSKVSHV